VGRTRAWSAVFDEGRIDRLKKLLDDLQSRLDPTAVTVVREQLDAWRCEVATRLEAGDIPTVEDVRKGLRRQTVIWRQLVSGDKQPEAYLGAAERARVRETMRALAWQRYRVWIPPLVLLLSALVFVLPKAAVWYEQSVVKSGLSAILVAAIGAVGISRASLVLTVRSRMHNWAELLWHRAVVNEVAQATLTVDQVFVNKPGREHTRIVAATARAAGRLRATVNPATAVSKGGIA
jgi:hypothetical protein